MIDFNIGPKLRQIRELKDFTQEYVASRLEITQNAYSKMERGETSLSVDKLQAVCKALEIDMNTFINFNVDQLFNNSPNTNASHQHSLDDIKQLYERLLQAKEAEIALLKKQLFGL